MDEATRSLFLLKWLCKWAKIWLPGMTASTGLRNLVPRGFTQAVLEMPRALSLHLFPSRAHSPHLAHYTLSGEQVSAHPPYRDVPSYKSIMGVDVGEQKVGSLLAFDTLLFTKKETEFVGCARDLPRSLLPASCLDMPQ